MGHGFKLLDSREGHRRWLVQLPTSPAPRFKLPNEGEAEAPGPGEVQEKGLESCKDKEKSRCTYAMANIDLEEVRADHWCDFVASVVEAAQY